MEAAAATVKTPGSSRNVSPAVAESYAATNVADPGETAVSVQWAVKISTHSKMAVRREVDIIYMAVSYEF